MSDHYKSHPSGIEAIEITQYETFLRGNIIKYVMRAPYKGSELEDLQKAAEYLQWEIERVKEEQFWEDYDQHVIADRLAKLDEEKTRERFGNISYDGGKDAPVIKRLEELGLMRSEWDEDGNYYDYFKSGFINGKTFDQIVYPDKCQECQGDCKVCED